MKIKNSDLERHLGYWLRFVSNSVSYGFRDRLEKYDVTVAEWVVLRTIYRKQPCTLNEVSIEIGVDLGASSRLVERLTKKKLVSRSPSSEDRRYVNLELTKAGNSLLPKLVKEADENDEYFFKSLSQSDQDHLLRIMKSLVVVHGLNEKPLN